MIIFYQQPYSPLWGNISWGHAHQRICTTAIPYLYPHLHGMISKEYSLVVLWWIPTFRCGVAAIYIFYTGVYSTDPTHVTLKDGKHPWREIQATAVTNAWGGSRLEKKKLERSFAFRSSVSIRRDTGFRDLPSSSTPLLVSGRC